MAAIREAITRGDFAPEQRLVESDLSDRFDTSRSAVRSALLQLTEEGLVEREQNRGARVRSVSLEEAVEICEVRMMLEGLCSAKAAERATPDEVAELRAIGDRMRQLVADGNVLGYSEANQLLHRRIRELSEQATAEEVLERLRAQSVRHQFQLALQPGRPSVSLPEHLAIIDAIAEHDPLAAETAMRTHLGSVIGALREASQTMGGLRF
ncbi:GntR family transcriptional regulator [Halostreptopolyspora alba]|uniref:GntR family transcriptional regulator n=1 Tax=Halostreptopolyspora alba TaxID=2487137 RepID=A0A3N0ECY5_9ACTN|nr:GntR family transcriptional regulator [Nocardiopsaceae bacterium YIM 96095]